MKKIRRLIKMSYLGKNFLCLLSCLFLFSYATSNIKATSEAIKFEEEVFDNYREWTITIEPSDEMMKNRNLVIDLPDEVENVEIKNVSVKQADDIKETKEFKLLNDHNVYQNHINQYESYLKEKERMESMATSGTKQDQPDESKSSVSEDQGIADEDSNQVDSQKSESLNEPQQFIEDANDETHFIYQTDQQLKLRLADDYEYIQITFIVNTIDFKESVNLHSSFEYQDNYQNQYEDDVTFKIAVDSNVVASIEDKKNSSHSVNINNEINRVEEKTSEEQGSSIGSDKNSEEKTSEEQDSSVESDKNSEESADSIQTNDSQSKIADREGEAPPSESMDWISEYVQPFARSIFRSFAPMQASLALQIPNTLNMLAFNYTNNDEGTFIDNFFQDYYDVRNPEHSDLQSPNLAHIFTGQDGNTPEGSLEKFVSDVNRDTDEYQIDLKVQGDQRTQEFYPSTDLVIVYDNSNSMRTNNRTTIAGGALANFSRAYLQNPQYNNRLALVTFGSVIFDGGQHYNPGSGTNISTSNYSYKNFTSNPNNIINRIPTTVPTERGVSNQGYTYLQGAIIEAERILSTSQADNKEILVITDGVPTVSHSPSGYYERNSGYYTAIHHKNTVRDARRIQNLGINMTSIGIEMNNGSGATQEQAFEILKALASSPDRAYNVEDVNDIVNSLNKVIRNYDYSIQKGIIIDPIGEKFNYITDSMEIIGERFTNGQWVRDNKIVDDVEVNFNGNDGQSGTLNVSNITLGANQRLTLRYRIKPNTNRGDFSSNIYYQTNGRTTLNPKPGSGNYLQDFPIPSVRRNQANLEFTKADDNEQPLEGASFTLEKNEKKYINYFGIRFWIDNWTNYQTIDNPVGGYFKFENLLEGNYRLTETRTPAGYSGLDEPIEIEVSRNSAGEIQMNYNSEKLKSTDEGLVIENHLIPTNLAFSKRDSNNNLLNGAEFRLYSETLDHDGNSLYDQQSNGRGGQYQFIDLSPGNYYLEEVSAPEGFERLTEPILVTVNFDNVSQQLIAKLDETNENVGMTSDEYTILNHPVAVLPETGGHGLLPYLVAGSVLVVIAIYGLKFKTLKGGD
ncbi:SpaA isopeptide-forming pilin-related protein [Aerococcus viridans]